MNISFDYLYRDAGNYKLYNSVIYKNENDVPLIFLLRAIEACLEQRMYFVPETLEIPRLKFRNYDPDLDHLWHEFDSISETDLPNTEGKNVTGLFKLLQENPQHLISAEELIQIDRKLSR